MAPAGSGRRGLQTSNEFLCEQKLGSVGLDCLQPAIQTRSKKCGFQSNATHIKGGRCKIFELSGNTKSRLDYF